MPFKHLLCVVAVVDRPLKHLEWFLAAAQGVVPEDKLHQQLTGSKACTQSMQGLLGCSVLLVDTERVQALPGTLQSAEGGL